MQNDTENGVYNCEEPNLRDLAIVPWNNHWELADFAIRITTLLPENPIKVSSFSSICCKGEISRDFRVLQNFTSKQWV